MLKMYRFPLCKSIKQIHLLNLLRHIRNEQINIILRNRETAVSEQLREGDYIAAVNNPLLRESMPVTVNSGRFDSSALVVGVEHMIARTFDQPLNRHFRTSGFRSNSFNSSSV